MVNVEWKIQGLNPLHRDFSGSSHTSDLKTGTPEVTLPGAWHWMISGNAWLAASILGLGEMENLICNFYLSVAVCKNCLSRSVLEIHSHVAGMLSKHKQQQPVSAVFKTHPITGSLGTCCPWSMVQPIKSMRYKLYQT